MLKKKICDDKIKQQPVLETNQSFITVLDRTTSVLNAASGSLLNTHKQLRFPGASTIFQMVNNLITTNDLQYFSDKCSSMVLVLGF